jgi:hypothetical protein
VLYGVSPLDPFTFVSVVVMLSAVAIAASYLPADEPRAPTRMWPCDVSDALSPRMCVRARDLRVFLRGDIRLCRATDYTSSTRP